MAVTLTQDDIKAIADQIASHLVGNNHGDQWLPPELAAKRLGIVNKETGEPEPETIRGWCRKEKVFQPGTEARKIGRYWTINVSAYSRRVEREQSTYRKV